MRGGGNEGRLRAVDSASGRGGGAERQARQGGAGGELPRSGCVEGRRPGRFRQRRVAVPPGRRGSGRKRRRRCGPGRRQSGVGKRPANGLQEAHRRRDARARFSLCFSFHNRRFIVPVAERVPGMASEGASPAGRTLQAKEGLDRYLPFGNTSRESDVRSSSSNRRTERANRAVFSNGRTPSRAAARRSRGERRGPWKRGPWTPKGRSG